MGEKPKSKHIYALSLPNWIEEAAKAEAKITHKGNVDAYFSEMIETLFNIQREAINGNNK